MTDNSSYTKTLAGIYNASFPSPSSSLHLSLHSGRKPQAHQTWVAIKQACTAPTNSQNVHKHTQSQRHTKAHAQTSSSRQSWSRPHCSCSRWNNRWCLPQNNELQALSVQTQDQRQCAVTSYNEHLKCVLCFTVA